MVFVYVFRILGGIVTLSRWCWRRRRRRRLVVLWCEVEIRNRKQGKNKRSDKRKDKTKETKRSKQTVSNVTALRWLIDLFLVTCRHLLKPTRRETFSFCTQRSKWTDVFRVQSKRQLVLTNKIYLTCSWTVWFMLYTFVFYRCILVDIVNTLLPRRVN